ncbi:MAG: hypothetical protein KIT84_01690 [Labilithrix sp.]|nr:hypothetical protein [Labilithrix sp.]MCW5809699.1 hypothetical protein [Labilithrix sp.]
MHTNPKRDAQKTEEAGLTGVPEDAPSTVNPSIATPPQPSAPRPTPSRQDRLDLERSSGEGMTPPPSNP